ncbi:MAG: hypothetical protein GF344_11165 [Chitinivibrionales bacterium]|nr:hypothetical protein [Chitinivibrionales bacterium]
MKERYGEQKAEKILRMEHTDTASKEHMPAERGVQDAEARTTMRQSGHRAQETGPRSTAPDAEQRAQNRERMADEMRREVRAKREREEQEMK